jgi:putative ABC transport system permease protein
MLTGLERGQQLLRVRSVTGEAIAVRAGTIWLPRQLAGRLRVETGDPVRVEWLRSTRERRLRTAMQVAGLLDVAIGGNAYGEYDDVRRSLGEASYPNSGFGASIACDPARVPALKSRLERSDDVAFVMTTADVARQIEQQLGVMNVFVGALLIFGSVLAGSTIYSVASISLLERSRELATLRTLGFSAGRVAWLAGLELLVLAGLGLLVGIPFGAWLNRVFIASFATENMSFRAILPWWIYAATVGIVLALVVWSSWGALRYLRQMDLAQATKARE